MRTDLDLSLQHHEHSGDSSSSQANLFLNPAEFPGGIAIWGALPPIYNTSICPPDEGVHVHARMKVGGPKSIDETFNSVEIPLDNGGSFRINGVDAAYYNVATILKKRLKYLACPHCGCVHSDREWYSVHYHKTHACENCNRIFDDDEPSISNPVMLLKELCKDSAQDRPIIDPVQRKISVRQERYPGGIQLWGSNPAIIWTSPKLEEGGVHFHGFYEANQVPSVDETFGRIEIDGIGIDPEMVRHLMAQQGLHYLMPQLSAIACPYCDNLHFDSFDLAADPHVEHTCEKCSNVFYSADPIVSNPMVEIAQQLKNNLKARS